MAAARSGNADAVAALLGHDASVNARDKSTGQTALMWAVRSNHPAAVQVLLEHGAEVNARTRTGQAPARRLPLDGGGPGGGSHGLGIVRGGWPERGAQDATPGSMTALLYAARDGRLDSAKLLVEAKADVNQTEANGVTPLLIAIANAHFDVARFLLDHGAAVNTADWWGRTPLWATVEVRNLDNQTANDSGVDRAAALDLFKTLLERGADVNARTKEYIPIRRWLNFVNDISWVDFTGQTPFLRAALAGDITVMRLLARQGRRSQYPDLFQFDRAHGRGRHQLCVSADLYRIEGAPDGSGPAVSGEGRGRERRKFHGAHGGDRGGESRPRMTLSNCWSKRARGST